MDRGILAILCEAYTKEQLENGEERIVLKIRPHLGSRQSGRHPPGPQQRKIVAKAKEIKHSLQKLGLGAHPICETTGNIGKGYRRNDEIGTPLCITVDFDTFEGPTADTVTVRFRDTMKQERIAIKELDLFVKNYFS